MADISLSLFINVLFAVVDMYVLLDSLVLSRCLPSAHNIFVSYIIKEAILSLSFLFGFVRRGYTYCGVHSLYINFYEYVLKGIVCNVAM